MGTKKQSRPIFFFFQKKSQNYALPNNLTLVTSFFFLAGLTTADKKSAIISEFYSKDFSTFTISSSFYNMLDIAPDHINL